MTVGSVIEFKGKDWSRSYTAVVLDPADHISRAVLLIFTNSVARVLPYYLDGSREIRYQVVLE